MECSQNYQFQNYDVKMKIMKAMKLTVVLLAALTASLLLWGYATAQGGDASTTSAQPKPAAVAAKIAPDFSLPDPDGKTVRLSDFKGKVVLLDFFATWCPPCRNEIPHFIEMQKQFAAQGFTMLGIAFDAQGATVVKPFARQASVNYPLALGDSQVAQAYGGVDALPTTFLIGRDGRILQTYVGYTDQADFEQAIQSALGKK